MRQQEYRNSVVHASEGTKSTGFTLDVNQSMFQMLTSNVYNNPVLAVIREWSTNSCDACIGHNLPVKYDVHLPTLSEPVFFVRDYGTGLSPEDITGLFSTLGASTKRDSDALNGTLGIGRMAGLAVSDAFTVDSYFDGMLYSYVVSMKEGIPVTLHLGATPTDEPNGLKLGVSVVPEDMHKYKEEAEYLYKYFDHKPNLNLDIDITMDKEDQLSEDWFIKKHKVNPLGFMSNVNSRNFVVMSQVPYEIPPSSDVINHGFSSLVIKVPPGSVTFNPGRESLSLDRKTVSYLNNMFNRVAKDFLVAANSRLALCNDDLSVYKMVSELRGTAPFELRKKISPKDYVSQYSRNLFSGGSFGSTGTHSERFYATKDFFNATGHKVNLTVKDAYYKTPKQLNSYHAVQATTFLASSHVIVDVKTNFRQTINTCYETKNVFIWQRPKGGDIDEAVKESKEYLEGLGIPYVLVSSLIETAEAAPKEVRKGLYASDVTNDGSVRKNTKMEGDEITNKDYLLLPLKGKVPELGGNEDFEDLMAVYRALHKVTEMPAIKGVAKKYLKIAQAESNWHDFATYIKEQASKTTFKICDEDRHVSFAHSLINKTTLRAYPKAIQEYFLSDLEYKQFLCSSNYVGNKSTIETLKGMGAAFEQYSPTIEVDVDKLLATFPKTLPILTRHGYGTQFSAEELAHFATMEEFYAIHTNDK